VKHPVFTQLSNSHRLGLWWAPRKSPLLPFIYLVVFGSLHRNA